MVRKTMMALVASGAAMLMVGCGGPSRAERAMAEKDAQIRTLETDKSSLQQVNEASLEQNKALAQQNQIMAEKHAAMAARTDARMSNLQTELADLKNRLNTVGKGETTSVTSDGKEPGAITIRVANTVLFDTGRATLKDSASSALMDVAKVLKSQYGANYVRVEGHTDRTPIVRAETKKMFDDNMELSQARAKAVYDWLVTKGGVPANRMYTAGYGFSQPVVHPERTANDKAKNRRVDIVILPTNVKVQKENLASK